MTLTPAMKFLIIAFAFTIGVSAEFWTAIDDDLAALGMSEPLYNIVAMLLGKLSLASLALVTYLGLRAPTLEKPPSSVTPSASSVGGEPDTAPP